MTLPTHLNHRFSGFEFPWPNHSSAVSPDIKLNVSAPETAHRLVEGLRLLGLGQLGHCGTAGHWLGGLALRTVAGKELASGRASLRQTLCGTLF